jgi:hypothetical protein
VAAEGQHRARLVVQGDARSASRELQALARQQTRLEREVEKANRSMRRQGDALEKTRVAQAAARTAILGVVGVLTAAAVAVDRASQRFAANANITRNLKISIDAARASTHGFVSDMDLARSAAMASSFGVARSEAEFAKLAQTAQLLAARLGTDTATALQDLTTAISRQSPMILDNLGITLKISEAHEIYARQLGKTVGALSDVEKSEAFKAAAFQKAEESVRGVELATEGSAASIQRFKVALENATDTALGWAFAVGDVAGPAISEYANALTLGVVGTSSMERVAQQATKGQRELASAVRAASDEIRRIQVATGTATGNVDKLVAANAKTIAQWRQMQGMTVFDDLARSLAIVNAEAEKLSKAAFFQATTEQRIAAQVHQIDLQIASWRGVRGAEDEIGALQTQRIDLLREEMALRGDIHGIVRSIRDEELAAARSGGGGGRRGDRFRRQRAEFSRQLEDVRRQQAFAGAGTRSEFTSREEFAGELGLASSSREMDRAARHMAELRQQDLVNLREYEAAKAEMTLAERLRAVETMRAEGTDPLAAIAAEEQARVDHLEFLRQNTDDRLDQERLRDQVEAEHHRARLQRMAIEEQRAAQHKAKMLATTSSMLDTSGSLFSGALQLQQQVNAASAKSDEEKAKAAQRAMAIEAFGLGTIATIKAALAFASLNIPQGIAYTAAAGLAFAKGALLASGAIGPGAASTGGGGGFGGFGGGGGSAANTGPTGSPSDVPTSRGAADRPPPPRQRGGQTNVVVNLQSLAPTRETARQLREELHDLDLAEKSG